MAIELKNFHRILERGKEFLTKSGWLRTTRVKNQLSVVKGNSKRYQL